MRPHGIDIGSVDATVVEILAKVIEHRNVVMTEFPRLGAGPERMVPQLGQGLASKRQGPFEDLSLGTMSTGIFQFVDVMPVPGTGEDPDIRIGLGNVFHQFGLLVAII